MEKEGTLIFRKTRKAFLPEYFSGVFLLLILGISHLYGTINQIAITFFIIGLAILPIFTAEFLRITNKYVFSEEKLVIINGIIKQHKKNVYYYSLSFAPDINIKQNRIQRLLRYGTVYVKGGGNSLEIKDVDHPQRIIELMENKINLTRKKEWKNIKR